MPRVRGRAERRRAGGGLSPIVPGYPRPSLAFPGGGVRSLSGEAARLLAQSGAPDKRGTKFFIYFSPYPLAPADRRVYPIGWHGRVGPRHRYTYRKDQP